MGKVEWHVCVSIIDSVQFFSFHESEKIVLDNWALSLSCMLGSGCGSSNGITESKDVFESLMLEGVWVHINQTICINNVGLDELWMSRAWWVNVGVSEWLFKDSTGVNVSECSNLFIVLVSANLKHFPSEHHINASLVTFVKSNLVSIWESEDFLVWCPVLDSCIGRRSSMELVLSHEGFVVKSIEISSLTLVWTSR